MTAFTLRLLLPLTTTTSSKSPICTNSSSSLSSSNHSNFTSSSYSRRTRSFHNQRYQSSSSSSLPWICGCLQREQNTNTDGWRDEEESGSRMFGSDEKPPTVSSNFKFPILVNGCTGKMGNAIVKSAESAGLPLIPVSFSSSDEAEKDVDVCGNEIQVYGPSKRESILASLFAENPDMIVVDYTVPDAVNDNADLYCKIGVPFVMGTTGGDRERIYRTVEDSGVYAVISPQMGKQVVAFLAAMEIMAEQFPGAFSGYSLEVMESHQSSKLDTSGTAKAVISCFQKLGVDYDLDEVQKIRDPEQQVEMVGVPEEYVSGHAFHLYHLTSPDQTVSFEFQHNVCGRSIYADGSIDAAIFLAKKVQSKAKKRIYNMIDVLREGSMR